MRCLQCDYPNPEDHRFCGKCGARLEMVSSPTLIDDNDPLEIEAPVYRFEDRSRLRSQDAAQTREKDRERELVRDAASRNGGGKHRTSSISSAVGSLPQEIIEPSDEDLGAEPPRKSAGIGGPSFLGLGYEDSSNTGFVYDKPRDDGFVYDTDGQTPEYLLEDVPRGVSWRAWALVALLLVGAGLGYIQWRASHHQGPDLASILARNGPTVDPSGPVMPDKSAKPAAQKPATPDANPPESSAAASASSAAADKKDGNASPAKSADAPAAATGNAKTDAPPASADASSKTESANVTANKVAEDKEDKNGADDANDSSADASAADIATASKPESDAPVAKATKPDRVKPVAETEPAKPKSLGDKDPLILRAEKYIQGRGVRKSCATGVNLLREAVIAGNPAADIKLGALYWSGTCVTQSKVTAYQWFSRAHSMEPENRWLERSRSSLWASMNLDERRKASD